jgi:hypothetical protein
MRSCIVRALAAIGTCPFAGTVNAADIYSPMTPELQQTVTEGGWAFSFAPYFWAAGLSGDVAQFGLPAVDVDASFSDIFDNLEFGAMAIGEARSGPYSIFAGVMYTKTSGQAGTPRGFLASDVELTSETFAGLWCRIRCLRERDSAVGRGGRPARLVCRKSAFLQRRGSRRALQKQ